MICFKDNKEGCNVPRSCSEFGCNKERLGLLSPKPAMVEIERLVDAMMQAFEDVHTYGAPADIARYKAARAALMVAIRKLL